MSERMKYAVVVGVTAVCIALLGALPRQTTEAQAGGCFNGQPTNAGPNSRPDTPTPDGYEQPNFDQAYLPYAVHDPWVTCDNATATAIAQGTTETPHPATALRP